ncbi:tRNA modification GTPase MnmE [Mannheimia haemolytica]|uniref:tRNA modification GTPase MnmE n=1 Tax=Mannheimia haemolytica TaxID=75985 RepID=A0A378MVK3_MANHA|nr:tRNA modification GTPase MnmE [Mannheimia haemolytica]
MTAPSKQADQFRQEWAEFLAKLPANMPVTVIRNKVDLSGEQEGLIQVDDFTMIRLSAQTKVGVDLLREHLKKSMATKVLRKADSWLAAVHLPSIGNRCRAFRARHIQLTQFLAGELLAEELRMVQNALSEITGQFTSDDLLGNIFSSFCIGK